MLAILLRQGPYGVGWKPFGGVTLSRLKRTPHGIDLGPLQAQLPAALFHSDRKIHLSADFFLDDLRRVNEAFFRDRQAADYVLIGRRDVRSNNSWLHNSQRLVKGKNRCTVLVHPDDAAQLGIEEMSLLKVSSRVGSVTLPAVISDEIMPGVVSIPHGWGHHGIGTQWKRAEAHAGVSVNDLTDETYLDVLSGNAALNGVPVQLEAVAG
nr:molybdopterin oxidoreductase family protein [Spongiibacter thalassae]